MYNSSTVLLCAGLARNNTSIINKLSQSSLYYTYLNFSYLGKCRMGKRRVGKCLGGKMPVGKTPRWETARWENAGWELSGGNCPVGTILAPFLLCGLYTPNQRQWRDIDPQLAKIQTK